MSGLTPLVDTLLATRLAQRVDLVPLKAQGEVAGPGPVAPVEKIANEIRLPSRAAFERLVAIDLPGSRPQAPVAFLTNTAVQVKLSVLVQAVNAILETGSGEGRFLRGVQPLLPDAQVPQTQLLAATLVHVVASSGLFYESHLKQYAVGLRTLAQMIQEPQALLGQGSESPSAVAGGTAADQATVEPGMDVARQAGAEEAGDFSKALNAPPTRTPPALDAVTGHGAQLNAAGIRPALVGLAASLDITNFSAIYAAASESSIATIAAAYSGLGDEPPVELSGRPDVAINSRGSDAVLIHPEAVALVRQQIELLDSPVFKWRGEVWPGTQMDWEIAEQGGRDESSLHEPDKLCKWLTKLTVQMPTLGTVEVRLSLDGAILSAGVNVHVPATATALTRSADELNQQLAVHGLKLEKLEINQFNQFNQI